MVRQVIRVDQRLFQRIAATQAHPTTRERSLQARDDGDGIRVALTDDDIEWHMHQVELQIGSQQARVRFGEQGCLGKIQVALRHRLFGFHDHAGQNMIVEVLAHTWQINHHRLAELSELFGLANT